MAEGSKLRITTNAVTSRRSGLEMEEFLGLAVSRNVIVAGEWPGLAKWESGDMRMSGRIALRYAPQK
jgi:hypothetical protein